MQTRAKRTESAGDNSPAQHGKYLHLQGSAETPYGLRKSVLAVSESQVRARLRALLFPFLDLENSTQIQDGSARISDPLASVVSLSLSSSTPAHLTSCALGRGQRKTIHFFTQITSTY